MDLHQLLPELGLQGVRGEFDPGLPEEPERHLEHVSVPRARPYARDAGAANVDLRFHGIRAGYQQAAGRVVDPIQRGTACTRLQSGRPPILVRTKFEKGCTQSLYRTR